MASPTNTRSCPPPTHREGPVKQCPCGAYLRSFTYQSRCEACRKGKVDPLDMNDVLDRINHLPFSQRAAAFDALRELHAEQEAKAA